MASAAVATTTNPPSSKEIEEDNPPVDFSSFHLMHDVFKIRGEDPIQRPLLALPQQGVDDFEYFSGKDLDRFTDEAAWHYERAKMPVKPESRTVAVLGPTNLDWVVSVYGLSRMGCTILALSPRLSHQAIVNLMKETECELLIYYDSAQILPVIDQAKAAMVMASMPMMRRKEYDRADKQSSPFTRDVNVMEERERCAAILHSSGSSGLPKPIYLQHYHFTKEYPLGEGNRDFVTLPLFHAFAFRICPPRMFQRKTVFFLNPNLPITCEGIIAALDVARPGVICAVPYVLKLLAEQESGIEALKRCTHVSFTGSSCPDTLGNMLMDRGVNLESWMGSTECGYIGASANRAPGDKTWDYLRIPPPMMSNIWPKPISDEAYEFVYLKNYPSRVVTNSNEPPDSFHSGDIFKPHSSIPAAWKYLGRLDDRVTLINGEKVLPLPIEGRIRQAALVKEAVVFGIEKAIPGLLLFRAETAKGLSDNSFISAVWPDIEAANGAAEGFSQISRDMVVPLPAGVEVPTSDKGSILRPQVYKTFEREIEDAYSFLEERAEGGLKLDFAGLEEYLMRIGKEIVGPQLIGSEDDLFALGLDSLMAIQMRGRIVRDVDLDGNAKKLGQNVIFEQGSVKNLAQHLFDFREDGKSAKQKPIALMKDMISRYSVEAKTEPRSKSVSIPGKHTIVLTGATGGLGAQLLIQLLESADVDHVYCLLRNEKPSTRLHKSLQDRQLSIADPSKLTILQADLGHPQLDLPDSTYADLIAYTTHIIHCAWPVNFQLSLSAFAPSIAGLQNLLNLSLHTAPSPPAHLLFCSSISAALGSPSPAQRIPETPIPDLEHASRTGYAQSKLVAERIVQAAVEQAGAHATVLRIGQVVGDTQTGVWNDSEAYPLVIRSALTMGILPLLGIGCEWLPVDTLARSILQIAGLDTRDAGGNVEDTEGQSTGVGQLVYNLVSSRSFSWDNDLLPALSAAGLSFRPISFQTWLHQLRQLSTTTTPSALAPEQSLKIASDAAAEPGLNPAVKLVDFFAESFGEDGDIRFETGAAEERSTALRDAPEVVESGLVGKMVGVWMGKWRE